MAKSSASKRPFFGWFVIAAGFLLMATCYATFVDCASLFQSHIVTDLGLFVADYNTAVAMQSVSGIVGALVIGRLTDKASARTLGVVTVLVSCLALVGFSFVTASWQLCILYAFVGLVIISGTRMLVSVLASNWFVERRGLALSIALSGSGVGGAIISPVVSSLILSQGWRQTYLILAVFCLVVALPGIVAFFATRPADKGMLPYGAKVDGEADASAVASAAMTGVGWKALRTAPAFWLMVAGFVIMGFVNGCIMTNFITSITQVTVDGNVVVLGGHDRVWAGSMLSINMVVVMVCKIVVGGMYDRFNPNLVTALGSAACLLAGVGLCFPATDWGPVMATVVFGFGTCMGTVAPPVLVARQFGTRDVGTVVGVVTALEMLGMAIGQSSSGAIFDATLSFMPVWGTVMVGSVLMCALIVASTKVPQPKAAAAFDSAIE